MNAVEIEEVIGTLVNGPIVADEFSYASPTPQSCRRERKEQ